MKEFIIPTINVSEFETEDIVTASGDHENITGQQEALQRDFWEIRRNSTMQILQLTF